MWQYDASIWYTLLIKPDRIINPENKKGKNKKKKINQSDINELTWIFESILHQISMS